MKLYFENKYGNRRVIAEPDSDEEAMNKIYKFCDDRDFEIYYVRTWIDKDGLKVYDVGSHVEFFYLDYKD